MNGNKYKWIINDIKPCYKFYLDSMFEKHEVKCQVIAIMYSEIHKIGYTCTYKVGYQYILAANGSNLISN